MATSTGSYLKTLHDLTKAQGAKVISSDFTFSINGYEASYLLCKQAPKPELTPQGEIEIALPLGSKAVQPQQVATAQQGQISFYETVNAMTENMLIQLLLDSSRGNMFDARLYEGTPDNYIRYWKYHDCFMQLDVIDRDWENRSQPMMFSGTLFFHFFGEMVESGKLNYANE